VVTVSSVGLPTSVPIVGRPLRLAHTSGATVQAATLGPMT
jgi:hypothetical protein